MTHPTTIVRPLRCFAAVGLLLLQVAGAKVFVLDLDITPPAGKLSVSAIPDGATLPVIDDSSMLSQPMAEHARLQLGKFKSTPVFVVLSGEPLPAEPEVYANELLRRWIDADSPVSALVLTESKPLAAVHVALAGRNLSRQQQSQLRQLGSDALASMPSQSSFAEGTVQAAFALAPRLAALSESSFATAASSSPENSVSATAAKTPPPLQRASDAPAPKSYGEALMWKLNWNVVRLVSSIVGGLLVTVCSILLFIRYRRRRNLLFPDYLPRKRFSGPFCGGSNAQISY